TTALAAATTVGDTPTETGPFNGDSGDSGDNGDNGGSAPGVGGGIGNLNGDTSVGGAGMVQSSLPAVTLWVFAMGAVAVEAAAISRYRYLQPPQDPSPTVDVRLACQTEHMAASSKRPESHFPT
ncbi:hypothetical protein O988_09730, partial [Pseudogymnoascus sp. VKM F-3808]